MVVKRAFTLVEIIFVLVVLAVLSAGTFKAIEAIYIRSAKAKALTDLSLESQIVLDQLSVLLYNRISNSVIGYDPVEDKCEPIDELTNSRPILEWLAMADDELLSRDYDGFVDMNDSIKPTLSTPKSSSFNSSDFNLIFAGAFDEGSLDSKSCSGAYGWHGADSNKSYDIDMTTADEIEITDAVKPESIYEKYYLTKTAYAVARGKDINQSSSCIVNLNISNNDINNTLFLFYDYRPFKGEDFCANAGGKGNVTILAQDVSAFEAKSVNGVIRLSIDMNRTIRGSFCGVRVSKQKGVF